MTSDTRNSGALTEAVFYILLALDEPLHGYGIMQFVKDISCGRVELGPGTLYGALNTMVEKRWIEYLPSEDRKKEYQITSLGQQALRGEMERLQELLRNGEKILGAETMKEDKRCNE